MLMAQAKIYWDLEHYAMVEKIFRQSAEFCSEHDLWKLNVAHVFFLQARARDPTAHADPAAPMHHVPSPLQRLAPTSNAPRLLPAGVEVQGGDPVLRARGEEDAGREHPEGARDRARQPVRRVHHDVSGRLLPIPRPIPPPIPRPIHAAPAAHPSHHHCTS